MIVTWLFIWVKIFNCLIRLIFHMFIFSQIDTYKSFNAKTFYYSFFLLSNVIECIANCFLDYFTHKHRNVLWNNRKQSSIVETIKGLNWFESISLQFVGTVIYTLLGSRWGSIIIHPNTIGFQHKGTEYSFNRFIVIFIWQIMKGFVFFEKPYHNRM